MVSGDVAAGYGDIAVSTTANEQGKVTLVDSKADAVVQLDLCDPMVWLLRQLNHICLIVGSQERAPAKNLVVSYTWRKAWAPSRHITLASLNNTTVTSRLM